jgi:modification methylase
MSTNELLNKIHCGDCIGLIPQLSDNSIDIVITSPVYNVDLGNNKLYKHAYDVHNDNMPYDDYIEWLKQIFGGLKPKLVSGGRVCINIGDHHNGNVPTHSDIIQFMLKELGYLMKTTIIWKKNQISNRCSWGSFQSPSNPSFPTPFEYILVFCKDTQNKNGDKSLVTITKEEFIDNSLALWSFAPHSNMNKVLGHPAAFPIELPHRLIQHLSYKNDIVLDPFSGSGTTCLAAAMNNRRWIGFELSEHYTELSMKRINKYLYQERLF